MVRLCIRVALLLCVFLACPGNSVSLPRRQFVQLTGIHLDPHYQAGSPATCRMGLLGLPCCRASSTPVPGGEKLRKAGPYGDFNCDSPYGLVKAAIQTIGAMDLDFVLDHGDRVGHHLLDQSFDRNMEVVANTSRLMTSLLTPPIFPTIGNHDTWPIDQWPDAPYTRDLTSRLAEGLFPQGAPPSFLKGGYYSTLLPFGSSPPIRLVVLCTLWDDTNNLMKLDSGPANQRNWLTQTLSASEQAGEVVWLTAHVYPSSTEATQEWRDFMVATLQRFNTTIRYQFYGHTHLDDFLVFSTKRNAAWMPGSIVPFQDHQPSFRVYEWDPESGSILDYVEWRASIGAASLKFQPAYRASTTFGLGSMEGSAWYTLWERMHTNTSLFDAWWQVHLSGNPSHQPCDTQCQSTMLAERHL